MAKKNSGTALEAVDSGTFAVIAQEDSVALLKSAFTELQIGEFNLHKLKCPTAGGIAWEVQTLMGPMVEQSLDVVLAFTKGNQRAWYAVPYEESGGGSPPNCASTDGVTGYGVNSLEDGSDPAKHQCSTCHWHEFGSARGVGAGPDCSESATILVFLENSVMPMRLRVPGTSLNNLKSYFMDLLGGGRKPSNVVTTLCAEPATSAGGVNYSKITFKCAGMLDAAASAKIDEVTSVVRSAFEQKVADATTGGTTD